jgi:membrane protein implicated in regulation of membrane protease activity
MKKYLAALGLVAACGICCAPLLAPAIAALGAGAGAIAGNSRPHAIVYIGAGTALISGATVWLLRRRQQRRRATCGCITRKQPSPGT